MRRIQALALRALAVSAAAVGLTGCPSMEPNPTPTPTGSPGPTASPSPTPTPAPGDEDFTLGLENPDPQSVAARPRAINPYGAGAGAALPGAVDLSPHLPPIGNQGQLGSCVAFAAGYAGATYTANRQYAWGAAVDEHQASPGYLYSELLAADQFDCGSGTLVDTAMNLLIRDGCASLASVGYRDDECLADPPLSDGANFRIGSYNRVEPTDRNGLRGELAAGRIVVIGALLWTNFMDHRGDDVYVGNGVPLQQGSVHAGHALAVVGYDDARGAYRIMNSWGTIWGDEGFMWMEYETFEGMVVEAYALEPTGDRDPGVDPGTDPDDPPPADDPEGFLDDAYQFADVDEIGQPVVYLIFFWHFEAPVFIRTITVTDPDGAEGVQTYNTWFVEGYVYFVQSGGFQWQAGTYTLEFDTQTAAGHDILYAGEATIAPLDSGAEGELCLNTCFYAFDGECDDGGAGSDFDVCDYGTDCADCGVRADGDGGDQVQCNDTCEFALDGVCDDGGPGAEFNDCVFGSDCTDCGPRDSGDDVQDLLCEDTCAFAFDGVCDDGGPGAEFVDCVYGTDCFDCGVRVSGEAPKTAGPRGGRTFRGVPQHGVDAAAELPPAGVHPGILGANRQPATVTLPSAE